LEGSAGQSIISEEEKEFACMTHAMSIFLWREKQITLWENSAASPEKKEK